MKHLNGIDTNILVRLIVRDNPGQLKRSEMFFSSLGTDGLGFISNVVLAELVWTLRSVYKFKKIAVIDVLEKILKSEEFEFENYEQVLAAFHMYRNGKADFSDYLILCAAQNAGCDEVATLDSVAGAEKGFQKI